jgi:hypothetical protein
MQEFVRIVGADIDEHHGKCIWAAAQSRAGADVEIISAFQRLPKAKGFPLFRPEISHWKNKDKGYY